MRPKDSLKAPISGRTAGTPNTATAEVRMPFVKALC